MASCVVAILSDIHYAGAAERARGDDYEYRDLKNPFLRFFVSNYRHFIWLRHPLQHGHLLDRFINGVGSPDLVIANGDYSCDTGFVGLSDAAACESATVSRRISMPASATTNWAKSALSEPRAGCG
jgi:hypothetical protein